MQLWKSSINFGFDTWVLNWALEGLRSAKSVQFLILPFGSHHLRSINFGIIYIFISFLKLRQSLMLLTCKMICFHPAISLGFELTIIHIYIYIYALDEINVVWLEYSLINPKSKNCLSYVCSMYNVRGHNIYCQPFNLSLKQQQNMMFNSKRRN